MQNSVATYRILFERYVVKFFLESPQGPWQDPQPPPGNVISGQLVVFGKKYAHLRKDREPLT